MSEETHTRAIFAKPALLLEGVRHEMALGLFRVGRDPQNNLVLEDSALSRTHFVIDVYGHQAQLIDVGSANGTYVNKKRVHSAWLKDGDRIRVGDHVLIFQAPGFVATQDILDEAEHTYHPHASKPAQASIVPMLALLVAAASLFMQLVNRDRQMDQDQEIKRQWAQMVIVPAPVKEEVMPVEKKWQKALVDFKSGSEDEACESIKALIPELQPNDLLKVKAKSFFERKCVL